MALRKRNQTQQAEKNQNFKYHFHIPLSHTTAKINQKVVYTTQIPVNTQLWLGWVAWRGVGPVCRALFSRPASRRSRACRRTSDVACRARTANAITRFSRAPSCGACPMSSSLNVQSVTAESTQLGCSRVSSRSHLRDSKASRRSDALRCVGARRGRGCKGCAVARALRPPSLLSHRISTTSLSVINHAIHACPRRLHSLAPSPLPPTPHESWPVRARRPHYWMAQYPSSSDGTPPPPVPTPAGGRSPS